MRGRRVSFDGLATDKGVQIMVFDTESMLPSSLCVIGFDPKQWRAFVAAGDMLLKELENRPG